MWCNGYTVEVNSVIRLNDFNCIFGADKFNILHAFPVKIGFQIKGANIKKLSAIKTFEYHFHMFKTFCELFVKELERGGDKSHVFFVVQP
jgi:hypothetical protein